MSNRLLLALLLAATQPLTVQAASDHEAGREIYNYRCYYCHGYSGNAKTLAANWMSPKPADFSALSPADRSQEQMEAVVHKGIPGTAMMSFDYFLSDEDVRLVVGFIRKEFMENKGINTIYHTAEAGWPNHDRYRAAFPFATGELAVDAPDQSLSEEQRAGKVLYLSTCISCHDNGRVERQSPIWRTESISYPRNNYSFSEFDGVSGASVFLMHDSPTRDAQLTPSALKGQALWDQNCAFCHAKDGTGHNWIGSFLEHKPRDLTAAEFMGTLTREQFKARVQAGIPNTSMPAWRGVLSEEQLEQLLDYIETAFHPLKADEAAAE